MTTSKPKRGQRFGSGQRRRTLWIDTLVSEQTANGTQDNTDLMATPSQFSKHGLTLVRTIVNLSIRPESPFGVTGYQALDIGMGVVEQDALAASALPDLNFGDDTPIRGWVFRKRLLIEDHVTADIERLVRVDMDLKAQRLIGDAELVLIINNNGVLGTAFEVRTEGLLRCLFKMP